jgi:uncharacterized protein
LLVPIQDGTGPIDWQPAKLQGDNLIGRASKKLLSDQSVILSWSAALLRMELDKWLWKDKNHIKVSDVWDYLAQYVYLPRLKDEQVLIGAIREGVGSLTWNDFFAYASAVRDDGHYVGLVTAANPSIRLDAASVLIKPDIAQLQIESERAVVPEGGAPTRPVDDSDEPVIGPEGVLPTPIARPLRRFHGSVELDPTRMGRDASRIADEVLSHLTSLVGSKATITLEISVEVQNGIPEDRVRIIAENCNTLKFRGHGFEEK